MIKAALIGSPELWLTALGEQPQTWMRTVSLTCQEMSGEDQSTVMCRPYAGLCVGYTYDDLDTIRIVSLLW